MKDTPIPGSTALYAVSLESAEMSIAEFKNLYPQAPTKAFTIHAEDFLESLGYTQLQIQQINANYPVPNTHARLYLGQDTTANSLKLFLVPVSGAHSSPDGQIQTAGNDQIPVGEYRGYLESESSYGPHVYDLIAPCPGTCDFSSPLYQAGQ